MGDENFTVNFVATTKCIVKGDNTTSGRNELLIFNYQSYFRWAIRTTTLVMIR